MAKHRLLAIYQYLFWLKKVFSCLIGLILIRKIFTLKYATFHLKIRSKQLDH